MEELKLSPIISESDIQKKIAEMAGAIQDAFNGEEIIALCVLKGSFMFYADLIRALDLNVKCDFIALSSYGDDTNSSGQVQLIMDIGTSLKDKNVLVIEDIVDTGLTMKYLLESIKIREPKKIKTASLLYKPEALKENVDIDYIGFEIGNEFVVGYGLDFQGFYRNIPYIARVHNMN